MTPHDLEAPKSKLSASLHHNPVQRALDKIRGTDKKTDGKAEIAQLSPAGRKTYLTILLRTILADGKVDADEVARLYVVFTLLDTSDYERIELLEQLTFDRGKLEQVPVPPEIMENEQFRFALAKDALLVGEVRRDNNATLDAVKKLLGEIALTPEQTNVMVEWVELENQALKKLGAGEEWMAPKEAGEIAARAAAVGVPLAAVYAAGSVIGFSAAGITSGLATIGSASGLVVLGLNPMTAGIAALIIAGVTTKKLADYALGSSTGAAKRKQVVMPEMLTIQLSSCARLATDVKRFDSGSGLLKKRQRETMVGVMQDALIATLDGVNETVSQLGS